MSEYAPMSSGERDTLSPTSREQSNQIVIGSKIRQHSQIITGTACTILEGGRAARVRRWEAWPAALGACGAVHSAAVARPHLLVR